MSNHLSVFCSAALLAALCTSASCGSSSEGNQGTSDAGDTLSDSSTDQRGDVAQDLTDTQPGDVDSDKLGDDTGLDQHPSDTDLQVPDGDAVTDTLEQQMERLFPGIRPECRPETLGCTTNGDCSGNQHCVGGGCVDPVAPGQYAFSPQIQRVRALMLPASSADSTFDFTGDGVPDNALADGVAMFKGGTDLVNNTVGEFLSSGQYTYLVELRDIPEDGCGPVHVALFSGTSDTDQDGLPNLESDQAQVLWSNFLSDGYGPAAQFNVAAFDEGLMMSGPGGSLTAPISLPDGTTFNVPLEGLRIRANLELAETNGPVKTMVFRPLDTPGAPSGANAELAGYIRLQSFVDEVNTKSLACACSGINLDTPVAELLVEDGKVKLQCLQSPDSQNCPETAYGRFCPNLAATCLALPIMSQLADVASGKTTDGQGNPIPDALSLGLYVQISPSSLAEPPMAPDFGAVDDTWESNPVCELLQDDGPKLIGVLLNDFYDTTVSPVIVSVGSTTAGGTAAVLESGDRVAYTPPTGFYGFDSFSYVIQDASGNQSSAEVEVRISPVVPYDQNLSCNDYCFRQCEQERVCQPDLYASQWGDVVGANLCVSECVSQWCPLWTMTSFCAQTMRMDVVCSSTLTCPSYQDYLAAVELAEAGLPIPELTPCGGYILARVSQCGTCLPGYYSPECQPCPGGSALPCGGNASCVDGSGGDGSCVCNQGYTFVDGACVDLDECAQQPNPCGEHGDCGNREGSYVCGCDEGYLFYGGTCQPIIDACNPNPCGSMAYSPMHTCTLAPGSPKGYSCDCLADFPWDPALGACRNPNDACDPNLCLSDPFSDGQCWSSSPASFVCQCVPFLVHFWNSQKNRCVDPCADFDCTSDPNSQGICQPDSSIGTPMCVCKQGYYWSFQYGVCRNSQNACDPDVCGQIQHGVPGSCQQVDSYTMTCGCETGWAWDSLSWTCAAPNQ